MSFINNFEVVFYYNEYIYENVPHCLLNQQPLLLQLQLHLPRRTKRENTYICDDVKYLETAYGLDVSSKITQVCPGV